MIKTILILGMLSLTIYAKEFRFDYEFNQQAGGWLKYHVIPATWDEARMRCHAEGAVLASPLTNQMKEAIVEFVKKHKDPSIIFTGVHATLSKGDYSSVEGVPLLRLAITWLPNEPDNYDNLESCLVMKIDTVSRGDMADHRCKDVFPYVCYKKDTNLTINECGTTDPEYKLERRTGSCYKFHKSGLLWSQAYMTCAAEGGYLAIINNDVEASLVTFISARHPENTIFSNFKMSFMIGFHDWGHRGTSFMTIHGESLEANFHKWSPGQPDNDWRNGRAMKEDQRECGGNILRNGLLDEIHANIPLAFLCEMRPNSLR